MDFSQLTVNPTIFWITLGIILGVMEFVVPGFVIFFFGAGAVITGLCCLFGTLPEWIQLLVFTISSVVMLVAFRRFMPRTFHGKEKAGEILDDTQDDVGQAAKVVEKIVPGVGGKVEYHGAQWNAQAQETLEVGLDVRVVRRDNITLIVEAISKLSSAVA